MWMVSSTGVVSRSVDTRGGAPAQVGARLGKMIALPRLDRVPMGATVIAEFVRDSDGEGPP